jgi:hypothetical protein
MNDWDRKNREDFKSRAAATRRREQGGIDGVRARRSLMRMAQDGDGWMWAIVGIFVAYGAYNLITGVQDVIDKIPIGVDKIDKFFREKLASYSDKHYQSAALLVLFIGTGRLIIRSVDNTKDLKRVGWIAAALGATIMEGYILTAATLAAVAATHHGLAKRFPGQRRGIYAAALATAVMASAITTAERIAGAPHPQTKALSAPILEGPR